MEVWAKKEVNIDIVISDGMKRVMHTLEQKTQKAIDLHRELTESVNKTFVHEVREFNNNIVTPKFL